MAHLILGNPKSSQIMLSFFSSTNCAWRNKISYFSVFLLNPCQSCHPDPYILKAKKFAKPPFQSNFFAEIVRKYGHHFWVVWGNFGPFWIILGHSRVIVGHLGPFWVIFGPLWAILIHFWAILWHFWANLRKANFFAGSLESRDILLECMSWSHLPPWSSFDLLSTNCALIIFCPWLSWLSSRTFPPQHKLRLVQQGWLAVRAELHPWTKLWQRKPMPSKWVLKLKITQKHKKSDAKVYLSMIFPKIITPQKKL